MKSFLVIILICFYSALLNAQIGVNTTQPNSFASIELNSSSKGLLLPRMTTAQRTAYVQNCNSNCPNGSMVFDTDKKVFYYIINNKWELLNPFSAVDANPLNNEPVELNPNLSSNLIINTNTAAGKSLIIAGKSQFGDSISILGSVNATRHLISGDDIFAFDKAYAVNGISTSGDITANGFSSNVNATNVAGPVPKGGIIMWAGQANQVPPGWAVCDGTNNTPDLSGRFVLPSGSRNRFNFNQSESVVQSSSNFNFQINAKAGIDSLQLNINQMPNHSHTVTLSTDGSHDHRIVADDGGGGAFTTDVPSKMIKQGGDCTNCIGDYEGWTNSNGSHTHNATVSTIGGGKSHITLPPYYVLIFIMKL